MDQSSTSDQPMTTVLTEDDLPDLLDLLLKVAHKWERLATYLKPKLNDGTIEIIKSTKADPEDRLMEVIKRWLRRTNPPPTVMALVESLSKQFVDEEAVALDVKKHFCPHLPGRSHHH